MISNINLYLNVFLYIFYVKAKKISKIVMLVYVYNTYLQVKIYLGFSGRNLLHSKQHVRDHFKLRCSVSIIAIFIESRVTAVNQSK